MELITFDEDGNCIGSTFMDYLLPTAWETPEFELDETVTPSPHHPLGAKGVGESATVGSPAAYVNAVVDALAHAGVRNIDMPVTSDKVLLEPAQRRPQLAVVGESPAALTLAQLARTIGWRVSTGLEDGADAVVVATMGRGDEEALSFALARGADYVGLVASSRRAGVVLAALRERGIDEAELARVRSPAGL